jgi:uncharacterized protein YjiS (DUF1127 family)
MSEIQSRPTPVRNETTGPGRELHATRPVGSCYSVGGGVVTSVMEAYALYGAVLYPPLMHWTRAASSPVGIELTRYCSDRTHGPGYATSEVASNDNLRALPPLVCDSAMRLSAADSSAPLSKAFNGLIVATKAAAAYLWSLLCYIRREREIARSISLLGGLDDRTLKDIGLLRSQITQAVRHGLDEAGRLRSPGP